MSTRTRQSTRPQEEFFDEFETNLDLDTLSDEELEELLFDEEVQKSKSPFNLPSLAGLSMIVVGIAYLLQQLGVLGGLNLGAMVATLPWLAGILIILLGFGVLSWRPKKKKRTRTVKKEIKVESSGKKVVIEAPPKQTSQEKKRLRKSVRDKKLAGVAGGIGEYFGLDPTLVRIAFVIGTIAAPAPFLVAYLILAIIMSSNSKTRSSGSKSAKTLSEEERITIIRDS